MPRISVIMPVYTSEKYVGEAIESILNQTYTDFELIVINDCSKDNSADVIRSYTGDPRVVFIDNKTNKGFLWGLNYGIEISKGEYIARLDDDDTCYPERLEKQIKYMDENQDVVLLGADMDRIVNGKIVKTARPPFENSEEIKFSLVFSNYVIGHSSFMIRKSVLIDHNIRYELFKQTPDYHMLCQMSEVGKLECLKETLVSWRIHPQQSTQVRSTEMKVGEADRTQFMHIDALNISASMKTALKKGVGRALRTRSDYRVFREAVYGYADLCGINKYANAPECIRYVYSDVMRIQRYSPTLLLEVINTRTFRPGWVFTRMGLGFIVRCILCYNKEWIGESKYLDNSVMSDNKK